MRQRTGRVTACWLSVASVPEVRLPLVALMALSREEVLDITRYLQRTVSRVDRSAYGIAVEFTERVEDPRRYLLDFLLNLTKIYSERSAGAYPDILDRMNHFVSTSEGGPIKGVSVLLTSQERELYGTEEVSFAELPDRTELISDLRRLMSAIARETEIEI